MDTQRTFMIIKILEDGQYNPYWVISVNFFFNNFNIKHPSSNESRKYDSIISEFNPFRRLYRYESVEELIIKQATSLINTLKTKYKLFPPRLRRRTNSG